MSATYWQIDPVLPFQAPRFEWHLVRRPIRPAVLAGAERLARALGRAWRS